MSNDKYAKLKSSAPGDKFWFNRKYIKTKQNRKFNAKFFSFFRVLHPLESQVYKLKKSKNWWIYNVFHISLLGQDMTRNKYIMEKVSEFDVGNSKEYEIEAIWENEIYGRQLKSHLIPGLYYHLSWKSYLE